jgi:hypothetical protein
VVDVCPHREAPLVGVINLLARIDKESDVLDSDVVVAVLASIGRSQPEMVVPEAEVDDLFAPAVTRIAAVFLESKRSKQP